ncbi:MAG: 30S ribosomal protein S12 methylthiotransferase RimO [Desulfobacteraceae bacterium]|nr:MAG: 30S ribosomal protein S12 methylthiotransferase RimO [Desulfobacteraceae bacterium]
MFLISLGCAKNLVDSENMLGMLQSNGFGLAPGIDEAEVAVVNTCGFIRPAVEEAIDTILEVVALKKRGALKKVVVTGCFVQRYGYKLLTEIPEVDGWLGTGEFYRVADVIANGRPSAPAPFFIGRPTYLADHSVPRISTEHFYSAYLKVAEGCSHRCSYCIIPSLRGPFRSRMPESLMVEAEEMISRGVKEINLVAQDTTMYGKDLGEGVCLEDLLDRVVKVEGIRWIRLLYCHPNGISNRLLELIDSEEVICPYLDVPQQHVNEKILRAMGRNFGKETPWALVERIRSRKRRISLRMTLMVGFPGETEEMFNELCDFVRMAQVDHLGVFIFSAEKGAPAACLQPTVAHEEAERRRDTIMALQADISKKINQRMVGYTVPVLVEGPSHETDLLLKGRTATMAPDVDAQVLINKGKGVQGEIMPVLIRQAHAYDLVGEIKG